MQNSKPKAQRSSPKFKIFHPTGFRSFAFFTSHFASAPRRAGITLLLVVLVLSGLLSISLGIVDVVLGEFRISGEITDSFIALYAADQGIEQILYSDRVQNSICPGGGSCSYGPVTVSLANGSCYTLRLNRSGSNTAVVATGEYRCASPALAVKRAFEATYIHAETSVPPPQVILTDNFGTGSTANDIPDWEEEGEDNNADAQAREPGSGDDTASPEGGRFAAIGGDEWICRSVAASGFNTLVLAYYWRGDSDAEAGETGVVEHRIGGSCDSGSGWTSVVSHELDAGNANSSAWSPPQLSNLPSSLDNTSFFLRIRNTANSGNEDFRIDALTLVGIPN